MRPLVSFNGARAAAIKDDSGGGESAFDMHDG